MKTKSFPTTVYHIEYEHNDYIVLDVEDDENHVFKVRDIDNDGDRDWEYIGTVIITDRRIHDYDTLKIMTAFQDWVVSYTRTHGGIYD